MLDTEQQLSEVFLPGVYEFYMGVRQRGTLEFLHDNGNRAALLNIGAHNYRPLRLFGKRDYLIFRIKFPEDGVITQLFMYEPINDVGKIGVNLWKFHHKCPDDNDTTYIMWANGNLEMRKKEND